MLTATSEISGPQLLSVGYRLTGSVVDALAVTDVVKTSSPEDDLISTVRGALAALQATAERKRTYVGQWLPEPVAIDVDSLRNPLASMVSGDGARLANMVALESLAPAARVAYLMRDVFDADPVAIGSAMDIDLTNLHRLADDGARQIAATAPPDCIEDHNEIVAQGVLALSLGDFESLETLVDPDIEFIGDSNGTTPTATDRIVGAALVLRVLSRLMSRYGSDLTRCTRPILVNGEMGLLTDAGSAGESPIDRRITALAVSAGRIVSVYDLANPEKLTGTPLFR